MSSLNAPNGGSPKWNSPNARASRDRQFRKLNRAKATLPSGSSRNLHAFYDATSGISSGAAQLQQTMRNSSGAPKRPLPTSSTPARSSTRSTKQTKYDTAVPDGQKPWRVRFHRDAGKLAARIGLDDPRSSPALRELVQALRANPKQFPNEFLSATPDGHVRAVALPDLPGSLLPAPVGELWTSFQDLNELALVNRGGHVMQTYTVPTPGSNPIGVVYGSDGNSPRRTKRGGLH